MHDATSLTNATTRPKNEEQEVAKRCTKNFLVAKEREGRAVNFHALSLLHHSRCTNQPLFLHHSKGSRHQWKRKEKKEKFSIREIGEV